ncbi:MAG: hypothetical protein HY758_09125 [Nitrospirae bacterium]|nr:hypothetical protein [Nitrospirota bacterium]
MINKENAFKILKENPMVIHRIVARFKDGKVLKGRNSDFSPHKTYFHITLVSKEVIKVEMEELKAVFFVKDLRGNKDRKDKYTDSRPWEGSKIKMHFHDGEVIIGYSLHYTAGNKGFFVVPADLQNNAERIFINPSSIKKITFL